MHLNVQYQRIKPSRHFSFIHKGETNLTVAGKRMHFKIKLYSRQSWGEEFRPPQIQAFICFYPFTLHFSSLKGSRLHPNCTKIHIGYLS